MAERILRLSGSLPADIDRGPAHNRAIRHTLAQFVTTAVLVLAILALLVQWNTLEVGDGEMPDASSVSSPISPRRSEAARALASRLRAERQSMQWKLVRRKHVTRRGLASLLLELNRNSGSAH